MSPATLYVWIKALHVASALIFVGGVLATSLFLAAIRPDTRDAGSIAHAVQRWDTSVTIPSMLIVWTLGLTVGTTGHWFTQIWLDIKLVFVVLLSGIHGVQSGRLRRIAAGMAPTPWRATPLILLCLAAIAILAVAKPF